MIASICHQHDLSKKLDLSTELGCKRPLPSGRLPQVGQITQEQALVKLTPGRTFGREYEIYPTKGMQKESMQKYRCVQIFTSDQI